MHPARPFLETDVATLVARARAHSFALVCATLDGRVMAAHAPILIDETDGKVALRFHLSANNAVTTALQSGSRALIVFTGPDAYISPDWYGMDDQVPTWNYLSVEAEGPVELMDDAGATQVLDDLSRLHESTLAPKPEWTRHKMTPGRFEAMLRGIRAFTLVPERFEGITKLGQNKSTQAQEGVMAALSVREDGIAIAEEMRKRQP
tara:strand:+ start:29762 stop:30379 length:618 start_codon:yes stop_codon:yes gene_type:complete